MINVNVNVYDWLQTICNHNELTKHGCSCNFPFDTIHDWVVAIAMVYGRHNSCRRCIAGPDKPQCLIKCQSVVMFRCSGHAKALPGRDRGTGETDSRTERRKRLYLEVPVAVFSRLEFLLQRVCEIGGSETMRNKTPSKTGAG